MANLKTPTFGRPKGMYWCKLPMNLTELCLNTTLRCGQSFRWRKDYDDIWSCTLQNTLLQLYQEEKHVWYRRLFPHNINGSRPPSPQTVKTTHHFGAWDDGSEADNQAFVHHYFNLKPDLADLYEQWSAADSNFKKKAPLFTGVRILKQDAWEALLGFICSSNNNIVRISQMMEKLCVHFGPLLGHVLQKAYYDLPTPARLAQVDVEAKLRELGFGYRAKYLHQTAKIVVERREGWLDGLRNPESPVLGREAESAGEMLPGGREGYRTAHEELLGLQGVGPKVADCVCLMGLGWGEAVPVDTHIWQIAQRDYNFSRPKHRSLTKATYDAIGDHFRALWGREAGWAHSVLFTADLNAFAERLVDDKVAPPITSDAIVDVKTPPRTQRGKRRGGALTEWEVKPEASTAEDGEEDVKVEQEWNGRPPLFVQGEGGGDEAVEEALQGTVVGKRSKRGAAGGELEARAEEDGMRAKAQAGRKAKRRKTKS